MRRVEYDLNNSNYYSEIKRKGDNIMNKRLLITSIMSIALLASVTTGATYALFAVEDEANVAITAGEVAVTAVVDQASLKTYSLGEEQVSGFANGGTATFDAESNLALSLMTPGDAAEFTVKIDNASTIKTKYRISVLLDGELAPALAAKAVVNGVEQAMDGKPSEFITVDIGADIPNVPVRVELPVEAENQWQGKSAKVSVLVEVLQANAPVADEWDGTASYEWFTANPDATEFSLSSAEDLAGFAKLCLLDEDIQDFFDKIKTALNVDLPEKDCILAVKNYLAGKTYECENIEEASPLSKVVLLISVS